MEPDAGLAITPTTLRKVLLSAAAEVGLSESDGWQQTLEGATLQAFYLDVQERLDDALWMGETDVFHDNEPTLEEVFEALRESAESYGKLLPES